MVMRYSSCNSKSKHFEESGLSPTLTRETEADMFFDFVHVYMHVYAHDGLFMVESVCMCYELSVGIKALVKIGSSGKCFGHEGLEASF